ncbi:MULTISPECIES: hypothetical protein [Clostridium]|uniref:Uncharacterized protein n=2 Tax=Clostridium TaxID=1485 RepID=A0AAV3W0D1_9CLOT|nr:MULTISPECIES: hypothetical protein [Clostridium]AQS18302.1 hypothetical protein X276_27150 [Clostridium beijerinckii NRRL B-598]NOW90982.1 hypothetical protein [Clostridium beijerinckii]NSB14471.1 hypothetical protein [Clostridium beijerinckii]QES73997.1 hypothetical protein F3K33_14675 [Clostridium diolis]GEA31335.1 hypothetical protein CDIOL_22580 [Clostridium diolis]
MKYIPTRNKNYAFVKCFIRNLMALILRLKVVPSMLVQSSPLRLASWAQLVILESSIIISLETGTTA